MCMCNKGKKAVKNPRKPPTGRPKANFSKPKKGKINFG